MSSSAREFLDYHFVFKFNDETYQIVKNTDSKFLGCALSAKRRSILPVPCILEILEIDGPKLHELVYKDKSVDECVKFVETLRKTHVLTDYTEEAVKELVDQYSVDMRIKIDQISKTVEQFTQKNDVKEGNGDAVPPKKTKSFAENLRGAFS